MLAAVISALGCIPVQAALLPEGLRFGEVELAGMSAEEAKSLLDGSVRHLEEKVVELEVDGRTITLESADLGLELHNTEDLRSAIDAYAYSNVVKRFANKKALEETPVSLSLESSIQEDKVKEILQEETADFLAEPQDASIVRENGQFVVTPDVAGKTVDADETFSRVKASFYDEQEKSAASAAVSVQEAQIKAEDLERIEDVLGSYSTSFGSSSVARATNIQVGTAKINGSLLMPGETLSGYELMHPFTVSNGYKVAGAYENGRLVDSVGGGVCQIATTLYNASIRAEVGITQRNNHSMTVSYVPASCDAAIAGTSKDLKITNIYDTPIYVEGLVEGRTVTFNIWGDESRPTNRTIEFVPEILSQSAMGVTYQDDPSLPAGTEVKVSSGHNGRHSKLWKVIKVDGVETERVLVSDDRYMMSNNIVRRGTGAAAVAPVEPQPDTSAPVEGPPVTTGPEVQIIGPGANLE